MQEKVECRIPMEPLLSLPKKSLPNQKKTEFEHFYISAAIQHLGDDYQSGHYIVHLVNGQKVVTIDDQAPNGAYIREGCMNDIEQSQLFFFKRITSDAHSEGNNDDNDDDAMDIFEQADCIADQDNDDDDDQVWV